MIGRKATDNWKLSLQILILCVRACMEERERERQYDRKNKKRIEGESRIGTDKWTYGGKS